MKHQSSEDAVPFHKAIEWDRIDETTWRGEVTFDWTQGRGAYGGLIVAGAVRSLTALVDSNQPARTVSCTFMAAVKQGTFEARAEILRKGANVAMGELRIVQEEKLCALVVVVFAVNRKSDLHVDDMIPADVPSVDGLPDQPFMEGLMPPCVRHFRRRWTDKGYPFSGGEGLVSSGWAGLKDSSADAAATVCGILDSTPFPIMQKLTEPVPVASIQIQIHLLDLEGADLSDWWWMTAKTIHAANGYSTFSCRLYRPDGKLGAWSEQLISVFDK